MPRTRNTRHPRLIVESLEPRLTLSGHSLLISEILADNYSVLTDEDGDYSDWLEIFNPTSEPIDLGGWYLSDDNDNLTQWQFPAHPLEAGGRLVVFASGKDRMTAEGPWHTNFRLDAEGEYLALVQPDGTTIAHEYAPNYPRQKEDVSYGLVQDVETLVDVGASVKTLVPSDGTLDLHWTLPDFDDSLWSRGTTGVGFEAGPGQLSTMAYGNLRGSVGTQTFGGSLGMDFVVNVPITITELGVFDSNADGLFRTLTAQIWSRSGNSGTLLAQQTFSPADPGELLESDRLKPLPTPLKLPPGDYTIVAYGYGSREPNGNVGTGGPGDSQKTLDDGNGALSFVGGSRYGSTAGAFPATPDGGPANRYSAGTFRYSVAAFDTWTGTDVETEMHGVNATVFSRIDFDVGNSGRFGSLQLQMQYDDGFVAYLNGVEIARSNVTGIPAWNSHATASRTAGEATQFESFNVTAHLSALRSGINTLAIHGLNANASDNDFLISPRLIAAGQVVDAPSVYFDVATPGAPNDLAASFAGFVDALDFSVERGFYELPLSVEITTPTDEVTIRYTTNGVPPTEDSGQVYSGPIFIDSTTTLSVAAFKEGLAPTESVTHSYVFLDDVVDMSGVRSGYPSTWGGTTADYGMSQNANDLPLIAGDARLSVEESKEVIKQSLLALPTMSIVMPPDDLFDARSGIYSNPSARGDMWERGASVEYLLPNGDPGFQINAGIQIMGGTSRSLGFNIKQSFRLVFKNEYGPGRLRYPFFPDNPVDSFNTLALRSNSRDNWTYRGGERRTATYLRDEWAKVAQADLGQLATSGRFVHLYLNGMYWGIYNPTERPDAAFVSAHTGAAEETLDTVKFCCPQRVVDGDLQEWNKLRTLAANGLTDEAAYQRIQGNNPDGTRNPNYDVLIDIDNFIDFVIHGQFTGSLDWPGNYYAVRDESLGFQFFTWDNDLAFLVNDKVTPDPGHPWWTESPGELDIALRQNAEYRMRFADRVQQHYFNNGALTSKAAVERWNQLADELRVALIAESARWGDYCRDVAPDGERVLYTPHNQWASTVSSVANSLAGRPDTVLSQLRSHRLYPNVDAPVLSQYGGTVTAGFQLQIDAILGTTLNEITLVAERGAASVWVPTSSSQDGNPGDAPPWTLPGFDASLWIQGHGGVGYEKVSGYEDLLGIDLLDENLPANQRIDADGDGLSDTSSVYTRFEFAVDSTFDASAVDTMFLRMRYDDGFVAYINGTEVLRVNAPNDTTWDSLATASHEANSLEEFALLEYISLLVPGQPNVLAIHGLNRTLNSSDFLISPELVLATVETTDHAPVYFTTNGEDPRRVGGAINMEDAMAYEGAVTLTDTAHVKARALVNGRWSALTEATFVVANLVISEINYNPYDPTVLELNAGYQDNDEFEFLELANIGSSEIDLTGVQLVQVDMGGDTQGIEFDFSSGAIKRLAPGERVLVVENAEAFAFRYRGDLPVTGQYSGRLSNSGEAITLQIRGETVQQFAYSDDWYPATDGNGASLEIIDPMGDLSLWTQSSGWRASVEVGGTPGEVDDDMPVPGDSNRDGVFNSADLVLVFVAGEYEDDIEGNSTIR